MECWFPKYNVLYVKSFPFKYREYPAKCHQRKRHISASRRDNQILKKVLKSFFKPILWDTKKMNTTSKLCLYCSTEGNFKNGEARIFLFWGFEVGSLILIKFLNLLSKNSRVGLEWKIFWSRLWMHKMIRL